MTTSSLVFVLGLQLQIADFVAICAKNFAVLTDVPDVGAAPCAALLCGDLWQYRLQLRLHDSEFDNLRHFLFSSEQIIQLI
jgi:hypothetical protein